MKALRPQSVVAAVALSSVAAVAIAGGADHDSASAGLWAFAGLMTVAMVALVIGLVWAERRQAKYRARLRGANAQRRAYVDPEQAASERVAQAAAKRAAAVQAEDDALIKARRARRKPPRFIVLEDVRTAGSEVAR